MRLNCVAAFGSLLGVARAIGVEKGSLRVNAQTNPIAVDTATPRLSWRLTSEARGEKQTAYQVQVSSSASFDTADLWDSGKADSDWAWALYDGKPLNSRDAAFWRLKVWDADDKVSEWSDVSTFEISLLKNEDWDAKWIKNENHVNIETSLPRFAKEFSVDCPVEKARLYILGLGLHYPLINSKEVSDDVMMQGYATLNKTMLYSTYDVLGLLKKGKNVLAAEVGKGIYDSTNPHLGRYTKFRQAARDLMLLAQLEYTCEDGTVQKVYTGEDWVTTVEGPWIEAHWFGGEEYDARKEVENWAHVCGDRSSWSKATIATPPSGKLVSPRAPPLRVTEKFTAKSVRQATNGQWVFDLGTNIAGVFTLSIKGHGDKAGTRITFWPGESAGDGGVSQASSGTPIFDAYTLSDSDDQTYTPRYIYHGHQYVGVNLTWTPEASDLVGSVVRANNEPVLSLSSSSELFEGIHRIVDRSIQGNMHSVLTDCPHREKYGWLEQDHLVFDPLAHGYDLQAYGDDLIRTIADAQAQDVPGLIPDIAPEYGNPMGGGYRNDPNWGSAMLWVPLKLYHMYGDIEILKMKHQTMIEYLDYLQRRAGGNAYLDDGGLGDWLSLELNPRTPKGASSTFGYYGAAFAMSQVEEILGNTESAAFYADLAQELRDGFHGRWFNQTAASPYYCENTQGCNAFALGMQAVPDEVREGVVDSLIADLEKHNYTMRIGEIALPSLFRALQAAGRSDVLYEVMSAEDQWGYGYMVRQGATSLWEHWDLPVTGGSRNHFMFGYGDGWLIQLAGLWQRAGSVAWKSIEYAPIVVGDLTSAKTAYRTPHGWAAASWTREGETFSYEITVPVGSTGRVVMPGRDVREGGGDVVAGEKGVVSIEEDGEQGVTTVVVGSGAYSFASTLG